jgi:hypothetical protein
VEAGPALTTDSLTFTFGASNSTSTGVASQTESFDLTKFKTNFTHTGIYRYYITEENSVNADGTPASNGYISYDGVSYTADLYVEQNTSNAYVVSSVVVSKVGTTGKASGVTFNSDVDTIELKIFKKVEGTEYQAGELFNFRILIPIGGTTITLQDEQTFEAHIYNSQGMVIDTEGGRTDASGNLVNPIQVGGEGIGADMSTYASTFQLKNGEYLEILAPVTMIYKVEEYSIDNNLENEGYSVSYKYVEYGGNDTGTRSGATVEAVTGNSVQGTVNNATNEVTFINTRDIDAPSNGISMDVLPYALLLVIAACGGFLLLLKKRKPNS